MDDVTSDRAAQETISGLVAGYALFAGILAWVAHLIGQSALTGWVCATGQLWPMHAITAGTFLLAAHALWVGRAISRNPATSPNVRAGRFLGFAAVVVNAFSLVLIVVEWVPVLFVHPCATG